MVILFFCCPLLENIPVYEKMLGQRIVTYIRDICDSLPSEKSPIGLANKAFDRILKHFMFPSEQAKHQTRYLVGHYVTTRLHEKRGGTSFLEDQALAPVSETSLIVLC